MRRTTGALIAAVLALMVCLPAQIGQTPKQALSPQMYSTLKGDSDKLGHIEDVIDRLAPIISANTAHLAALDQQMAAEQAARRELEARLDRHEAGQVSQPTDVAVLKTQLNAVIDGQRQDRAVASWILTGVGSLLLGLIGFAGKALITKGLPPAWAAAQSDKVAERLQVHEQKQDEYREHVLTGLQEVKSAAHEAFQEANTVNQKLANIGVEVRDGKPLKQESTCPNITTTRSTKTRSQYSPR